MYQWGMAEFKLTEEQEELAIDMILMLKQQQEIARKLGFKNRNAYSKYLIKHPEFFEQVERAVVMSCLYLEDDLLAVADDYNKDNARVKMESIARVLKFRNPKKYGDKLDMSVAHTIDISGSLERAEKRIIDVTASNVIAIAHGKKTED